MFPSSMISCLQAYPKPCHLDSVSTNGINAMPAMLRACVLCVLLGTVLAKGGDDEGISGEVGGAWHALAHSSWWTVCGLGELREELLAGILLWVYRPSGATPSILCGFLHSPSQFLPFLALYMTGWVDCDTGLWWPVHWAYMLVLMLAMPFLTQTDRHTLDITRKLASIPILGCRGSTLANAYFYMTTLLSASDQYLDSMTAAIALQCDWRLAWVMTTVIFVSIILQVLAAGVAANGEMIPMFWAFLGVPPEAAALAMQRRKAMEDPSMERDIHFQRVQDENDKRSLKFVASQGIAKLVTENIPQAYLAIKFAEEVKPSKTVWFSAALSLALGTKAFIVAMSYFCTRSDAPPVE